MGFNQHLANVRYDRGDPVEALLVREYGAMFAARGVIHPPTVIFRNEEEVAAFQGGIVTKLDLIGGYAVELQGAAMANLLDAVSAAANEGLAISPRGADSARRSYNETIELWLSRVEPALAFWTTKKRITADEAAALLALEVYEQVKEVLRLESIGIYFARDLSKSIIYSVAPPGTSQHLSMLAFDVNEHDNAAVRSILASHGWFQTVASDLPHFTFLGEKESELRDLGLKAVASNGRTFWLPEF